ncbi:hypothetical protein FJT64_009568 [Amphibalanus amphitrite]|uniref:Uncharacterized protein n=1 Tax=Amphibalanus amphitrite TaxID=1232801 RepID=A0A6A4VFV0_AMPAM|nr:hypothetical protein FJT64_009568 [Amphibalanus amphitrite]
MREVIDGRMKIGTAGPIALGSRFGWIISGPSGSGEATQAATSNFIRAEKAEDLLQDLWSLEKANKFTDINAFKKKSNQTIEAFTTANNGCSAAVIRWMDVVEDHEFQEAIMPSLGKEEPADAP